MINLPQFFIPCKECKIKYLRKIELWLMALFIDKSQMCRNRKYKLESKVKCLSRKCGTTCQVKRPYLKFSMSQPLKIGKQVDFIVTFFVYATHSHFLRHNFEHRFGVLITNLSANNFSTSYLWNFTDKIYWCVNHLANKHALHKVSWFM
jgi:hypothetical protein